MIGGIHKIRTQVREETGSNQKHTSIDLFTSLFC